mmetsp:Transcript_72446/g.114410  ORF Transcript_72446/g.114410 Transcript_72446/m.114410 type:complete len:141 (+) Transcript_72446:79-501(+)
MVMRYSCPLICGCANAFSGLGKMGAERYGCPTGVCAAGIMDSLQQIPCNDSGYDILNSTMATEWRRLVLLGSGSDYIGDDAQHLLRHGCAALHEIPEFYANKLCKEIHGASAHCPVACNCSTRMRSHEFGVQMICPGSCH